MMGVVFALSGTLGSDDGLYVSALRHLVGELHEEGALVSGGSEVDDLVERVGPTLESSPPALDVLVPFLRYGAMSAMTLKARFRTVAAELVPRHFSVYEDSGSTLEELRELNVPRALVSEGWSGVDHAKAKLAGFDGTVIPGEDAPGGQPRSLSAFANLAATLRLPSDRLWFVGSEPRRDIAPARAAGFQTVWLRRNDTPYPSGVAPPDHTIRNLGAFLELIGEPYTQSALTLREILGATLSFRFGHVIPTDPMREP